MNNIKALKVLDELKENYISRTGLIDSETTYPALVYTINVLKRIEILLKHLDELEVNEKNKIASTLFGALIGTCKVKDILLGEKIAKVNK